MSTCSLPSVRLGGEDAELFELLPDIFDALFARGRQRRTRRSDRPPHQHHSAFERRRILIAEKIPQARELELKLARFRGVTGDARLIKRGAEIRADGAGR